MSGTPLSSADIAALQTIERRAIQLDGAFRIPLTRIHVGWDPIVSAVPIIGDITMAVVGLHLVANAARLGIGPRVKARMLGNVALDTAIGMIPFAGPILDIFFRSNARNLKLLLDDLQHRHAPPSATHD